MLDETGRVIVEKLQSIAEALGIDAVCFTEQVLTEAQKAQARQNIGALGAVTIPTKVSDLENDSGFQNASQVAAAVAEEALRATAKETEIEAAIPDVSAFITKFVNDLVNYYTKSAIDAILAEKQDDISDIIPAQASSQNKLADKDFVNSSVQTASANFRGNWATKSAIPTDYTLYPADYAGNRKPTTNDYLVVQADESQDGGTWRYKYSGDWDTDGVNGWFAEYEVNETPLTATQLAALNSGITQQAVQQIADNAAALANRYTKNETDSAIEAHHDSSKQDSLTFDSTPTASSTNPVTSGGVKTALDGKADKVSVASSIPQGGLLPNVLYNVGTLEGSVTIDLAAPADSTVLNLYHICFATGTTAPSITWGSAITSWMGGSAPTINASKHYEVSVLNGVGVAMEV